MKALSFATSLLVLVSTASFAAPAKSLVCVGVENTTNNDPHTKMEGVRVVLDDTKDTAVVSTYRFEAHEAYLGLALALTSDNLVSTETFEVRYEHDSFGTYFIDAKSQTQVATLLGADNDRELVREIGRDQVSYSLSCSR